MEGNVVVVQDVHAMAKADGILVEEALELSGCFAGGVGQEKGEILDVFFARSFLHDLKIGPLRDHAKSIGNGAQFL